MLSSFIDLMSNFFLKLASDYGYFGIFLGAFADSIFPIVPSEAVLGITGVLIGQGILNLFLALFASVLGNLSASIVIWYAGKKLGLGLIKKFGKWLNFTLSDYEKASKLFEKRGYFAVFYCQFIPLLRSLISIPSGILNLGLAKFVICTALGATIWNASLIYVGYLLQDNWRDIEKYVKQFGYPLLFTAIIVLSFLLFRYLRNKNQDKAQQLD